MPLNKETKTDQKDTTEDDQNNDRILKKNEYECIVHEDRIWNRFKSNLWGSQTYM